MATVFSSKYRDIATLYPSHKSMNHSLRIRPFRTVGGFILRSKLEAIASLKQGDDWTKLGFRLPLIDPSRDLFKRHRRCNEVSLC
jgi:hypothetical protein